MFDAETGKLIASVESNQPIVPLVEITPATGDYWDSGNSDRETKNFCSYSADITINQKIYDAFPFEVVLPKQQSNEEFNAQSIRISFDNVSLELTEALRRLTQPATVRLFYVNADRAEATKDQFVFPNLKLKNCVFSSLKVECELVFVSFFAVKFPSEVYDTETYLGLI